MAKRKTEYGPTFDLIKNKRELAWAAYAVLLGFDARAVARRKKSELWDVDAVRRLVRLLSNFQHHPEIKGERPPRWSEVTRQMKKLIKANLAFRREAIEFQELWNRGVDLLLQPPPLDSEFLDVVASACFLSAHADRKFNASPVFEGLFAQEEAGLRLLQAFPKDVGGGTNVLTGKYSGWKCQLVVECGRVFLTYRPNDTTVSESGPFYLFCSYIYEILRGEEGDAKRAGLIRYVRFAVPLLKELREFLEVKFRLERSLSPSSKYSYSDASGRATAIGLYAAALHRRLQAGPLVGKKKARADADVRRFHDLMIMRFERGQSLANNP